MKPTTVLEVVRQIRNWPEVVALKYGLNGRRLSLLSTRDGIEVLLRRRGRDWDIFRELFVLGAYSRSLEYIAGLPAESVVLDLGGNIGCFSLRAASVNPRIRVHSYEPGPPNQRIFQLNLLANPDLAQRIELHPEAVAGVTTQAQWSFDEENAGGSSLYAQHNGATHAVSVRAFRELVDGLGEPIGLAKIDIEGAEYDLLRHTPAETWSRVAAFTIELHNDPAGEISHDEACERFRHLGYSIEQDDKWTVFCRR